MRYRTIYPEKLLRPANIPPRFTLPARLYPFPSCVATYPAFKAFEILSSETARSWKEIRLELFIHTIQEAKWKRKRGEETEAERKTGGIDGETGRGGKDKRGKMRKVENRDRERAGWERETAEKCELNELWDADCKPATFIHSLHHIHDKELWRLFFLPFPPSAATCCLSAARLSLNLSHRPMFTLPPRQKPTLTTTLHGDEIHQTSGTHAHIAVTHVCQQPSTGATATLCGVVRSGKC